MYLANGFGKLWLKRAMANGGSGKTRAIVKEALKTPTGCQMSPHAAMALGWQERRNGGCSESP